MLIKITNIKPTYSLVQDVTEVSCTSQTLILNCNFKVKNKCQVLTCSLKTLTYSILNIVPKAASEFLLSSLPEADFHFCVSAIG
jgi:hypothetical protein